MADNNGMETCDYVANSSVIADSKKTKKPMMEKLRRERINNSLNEMKILVLEALQRDSSRYSKMEKADILEMTVKYLRQIQYETRARKEVVSSANYRLRGNTRQPATDGVVREMFSIQGTHQLRTNFRPHLLPSFHGNSLQHSAAPALQTTTPSVAMTTTSNRTLRWVPSPPSSPTGSKPATSYACLQPVSNVVGMHSPIVTSPGINSPVAITSNRVLHPTDRLLWRGW